MGGQSTILRFEDGHHQVVVPLPIEEDSLALDSFHLESALFVAANRPHVVLHDSERNSVQLQLLEAEAEDEASGLSSDTPIPIGAIENADTTLVALGHVLQDLLIELSLVGSIGFHIPALVLFLELIDFYNEARVVIEEIAQSNKVIVLGTDHR